MAGSGVVGFFPLKVVMGNFLFGHFHKTGLNFDLKHILLLKTEAHDLSQCKTGKETLDP